MFRNDAKHEFTCLNSFHALDLCPTPIAYLETDLGPCVLYHHIEGHTYEGDEKAVAIAFSKLHQQKRVKALRKAPMGAKEIRDHGLKMLRDCDTRLNERLIAIMPIDLPKYDCDPVPIHGDPVAKNIIMTPRGAILIDWQSPAMGNASEDLCHFLSPAMRSLYHASIITKKDQDTFLDVYAAFRPNFDMCEFHVLRPFYHWRLACYCAWKMCKGQVDYRNALTDEIALLKQLQ